MGTEIPRFCTFAATRRPDGQFDLVADCGIRRVARSADYRRRCDGHCLPDWRPPPIGVGGQIKLILAAIGVSGRARCGCDQVAAALDRGGIEAARRDRGAIAARLASEYQATDWRSTWSILAGLAANPGLAADLAARFAGDPFAAIVDLAIERAAAALEAHV